jgi:formiminotetrahydrofolate cyclodeaminase
MEPVSYASMPLAELLDAFSSRDAVPGGGSAAALAGALGASLLLMTAALPKTKTGSEAEKSELAAASERILPLRNALRDLVDRDSQAYGQVVEAFRLANVSEDDKAKRRAAIGAAMRAATDTPLDIMRSCREALRDAVVVATNVQRNAASDVGVAIELLVAGLHGARLNVAINLSASQDADHTVKVNDEATVLERDATLDAESARQRLR